MSTAVDDMYNGYMAEFAALMMSFIERAGVPLSVHDPRQIEVIGAALAGSVIHAGLNWVRSQYSAPIETVIDGTLKVISGTAEQLRIPPR